MRPGEKLFEELFDPSEANEPAPTGGLIVAKPRLADLEQLLPHLDRIERYASSHDTAEALGELRHIVPEYDSAFDPKMTAAALQ